MYGFEIRVPCAVSILIVKKKGYINVGRQHVAEEYIVIVFKGAHVPFVLRKRKEQYLLVGDAYVNGGSRERGIFSS